MMENYFEALERLAMPDKLHIEECKKAGVALTEDYDVVKQALLELKSIKEANLSKAMKGLHTIAFNTQFIAGMNFGDELRTIEQALLKLNKYEQILGGGRLTDRNYKNTTLDLDSCKPYLRLGQLEDVYEEGK